VAQLKDVLEAEGIPCLIKNENLSGIAGEVPFAETFPELWIQNDSDLSRAASIKAEWKTPNESTGEAWICPNCNEQSGPQFTSCWKCGTAKPQA
jgi:hypothetical protein